MAKRPTREVRQKLPHDWPTYGLLTVVFLVIGYGLISLAIDSGHLIEWALGGGCFIYALAQIGHLARALRQR